MAYCSRHWGYSGEKNTVPVLLKVNTDFILHTSTYTDFFPIPYMYSLMKLHKLNVPNSYSDQGTEHDEY